MSPRHRVAAAGLSLLDGADGAGVGVASPAAARVKHVARGASRAGVGVHAVCFERPAQKAAVETPGESAADRQGVFWASGATDASPSAQVVRS